MPVDPQIKEVVGLDGHRLKPFTMEGRKGFLLCEGTFLQTDETYEELLRKAQEQEREVQTKGGSKEVI